MTRLVALLVPAALLGVLLGCGKQNDAQQVAENTSAVAANENAKPADTPTGGEGAGRRWGEGGEKKESAQKDGAQPADGKPDGRDRTSEAKSDPSNGAGSPGTPVFDSIPLSGSGPGGPPGPGTVPPGFVPGRGAVPTGAMGPGGLGGGGIAAPGGPPAFGAMYANPGAGGRPGAGPVPAAGGPVTGLPAPKAPAAQPGQVQAQGQPVGENPASTEQYGVYRENEFRSPLVAALSTFSADVNTASYANVRRMLQAGVLPPKDAIFLAEFVNYFPYQYATPRGEDPIEFNLEMGPCPWNRKHHLVRVGVQAQKIDPQKMPARNLVFLMDTSGSMSPPNRLPLAKQAINLVIDQLGEKDVVSIVTYAGDSRVALGPTKGSDKEKIKEVMSNLRAEGSTNGEGGITNAYRLAREAFLDGGVNRVILCTDGDFNVGVTGKGELVRMIEEYRKSKVFLTILGFGMGNYKDDTLKELANHGNGHHAYIDTLDEAKKVFVDQGGALVCVAKDVKFQVDFNPAKVAAYRLVGYENRLLKDEDFRNDAKDAGDMSGGHQVTVLYEIVPVGVPIDLPGVDKSKYTIPTQIGPKAADEWLTVKMRYKHPEADVSKELGKPLPGKALGADLSDDFRFAAAAASFGMLLRDSQFRGAMTYAGVLEEAQGCLKTDPGGHRKEFVELVKKAKEMSGTKPGGGAGTPRDGG